jgi:uncharacterized protein YaaN involved in tellurite resistance
MAEWEPKRMVVKGVEKVPTPALPARPKQTGYEPKPLFTGKAADVNRVQPVPTQPKPITPQQSLPKPATAPKPAAPKAVAPKPKEEFQPKTLFPTIAKFKKELNFEVTPVMLAPYGKLSIDETAIVRRLVKGIDLSNTKKVLDFGAEAQESVGNLANEMASIVRTGLDDVYTSLKEILETIEDLDTDDMFKPSDGLLARVMRRKSPRERFADAIAIIEDDVSKVRTAMPRVKDRITVMDDVLTKTKTAYMNVNGSVISAELVIAHYRETVLPQIEREHDAADVFGSQEFQSVSNNIKALEGRVDSLKLSRVSALHTIPQVELIKGNYVSLYDKCLNTIFNSVGLWKSQCLTVLALMEGKQNAALGDAVKAAMELQQKIVSSIKDLV